MDFRNDTSSWCAASLSAISLRYLACSSINWRLCSSCCRSICFCNNSILSSRAATSPCKVRVVGFQLFQSAATQKRTYFCHECRFRLGLGGFQLLRLDFFFDFVKFLLCLLAFGLQLPHIGFKLSRLPFQVTGSIGRWWCAVLPNLGHHAASRTSTSLRHSCRGRRQAFLGSGGHRRTGARRRLSCGRCVCPPSASSLLSCARLSTIGTTVAWMCGVCSSMCSTAETVFSLPNVRCSPLQVVIAPFAKSAPRPAPSPCSRAYPKVRCGLPSLGRALSSV